MQFDQERLAQTLYYATIKEVAKAQQEILLGEALMARFGDRALAPSEYLLGSSRNQMSNKSGVKDFIKRRENFLKEKYELLDDLEARFKKADERDAEAFADFVRERYRK